MSDSLKLSEMLMQRFTHDIIGPVGALSNGAEFLREELGQKSSMAADLIESSSKEAVARVQYYRQAYGYSPTTAPSSMDDVKDLATKYFAAGKTKLQWGEVPPSIASNQKKILLNLLIIASGTLIRGGIITITIKGNNFTISSSGEKASLHENFRKSLRGELTEAEIDARLIQCHYTYLLAEQSHTKIEISEGSGSVVLSFTL